MTKFNAPSASQSECNVNEKDAMRANENVPRNKMNLEQIGSFIAH